MFTALRSGRIQPPSNFSINLPKYPSVRPISRARFRQAAANCSDNTEDMEQSKSETRPQPLKNQSDDKKGDVMSHSYGEGYSSRSDDDGFGGIYGGKDSLRKDEKVDVNHPEYDKGQGSEVKEKEKARHQSHDDS